MRLALEMNTVKTCVHYVPCISSVLYMFVWEGLCVLKGSVMVIEHTAFTSMQSLYNKRFSYFTATFITNSRVTERQWAFGC